MCLKCAAYICPSVPKSDALFGHVHTKKCLNFLIKEVTLAYDYWITLRNDESELTVGDMFSVFNRTLLEKILESWSIHFLILDMEVCYCACTNTPLNPF